MLTIKQHLDMLCAQYLANTLRECHPSHSIIRSLPVRRSRTVPTGDFTPKKTLWMMFRDKIRPFLVEGNMPEDVYKPALKSLHTQAVSEAIATQEPNRVLGVVPPNINEEEEELPRPARTALAQLRSGFSMRLNSYKHSINLIASDLCPECGVAPHSTQHLFCCNAKPTTLSAVDLWLHPKEVVAHLVNLISFDDILPADPPAPPPPPEPPP